MVILNPISIAGRGGPLVQNTKLPAFTAKLTCIGGANPPEKWCFQWNFLSLKSFSQLSLFMGQDAIPAQNGAPAQPATHFVGYGAGTAPAQIVDEGGPMNVFLNPVGIPQATNVPIRATTADLNAGNLSVRFDYDGNGTFIFDFIDSLGAVVDTVTQNFPEPVAMFRMEPVGQGVGQQVKFKTGAFRLEIKGSDVLNAVATEAPISGIDEASGKPVMWVIGTAEGSNIEVVLESQDAQNITLDYLVAP